ncbi:CU044_5270 family protein [Micromonospora sp. NPDC003197]
MTAVRDLLHQDLVDSSESMNTARTRLDTAIHSKADGSRTPRFRLNGPLRWSLGGTGLLAAAAAAALALGSGMTAPVAPPSIESPSAESPANQVSAQQVLLTAAERIEQKTSGSRYWRSKTLFVTHHSVVGGYQVTNRRVEEHWTAAKASDKDWIGTIELGTRPSTPADEVAWRAAGSPTEWSTRTHPEGLRWAAEPPFFGEIPNSTRSFFGELEISLAEIQQLPADPVQLRAWGVRRFVGPGNTTKPEDTDAQAADLAMSLLGSLPTTPAVRAAAFRLLAGLPGTRNAGPAQDALGRAGVRIVYQPVHGTAWEMIVDQAKGQLLTNKIISTPIDGYNNKLILIAEWTDARPTSPTAP